MKSASTSIWPHAEIILRSWILFKINGYKMAYKNIRYYDSMYPFSNMQGILSMLSAMLSALYMLLLGDLTRNRDWEKMINLSNIRELVKWVWPGTLTPHLDTCPRKYIAFSSRNYFSHQSKILVKVWWGLVKTYKLN